MIACSSGTDALLLAHEHIAVTAGEAYNIGGGPANTISLLELLDLLADVVGRAPAYTIEPWRPADQRFYVSDWRKFARVTGWEPGVGVRDGVRRLVSWLRRADLATRKTVALGRVAS